MSASCVHIPSLLHALVAMTANNMQLHPSLPSTSAVDEEEETMPITSYLCQWKVPKKRKESNQPISAITFEKHDYQKQKKRKLSLTEATPLECKGTAQNQLDSFLENVCGESLGVSVLFDPVYCRKDVPPSHPDVPTVSVIKATVATFKESFKMPPGKLRQIEQSTREQRNSSLWFSVCRYRITASRFGEVLRRRTNTPPDKLVLSILQPRSFSSVATDWVVDKEPVARQVYVSFQHEQGNNELTVGPSGFLICESHPFLGASPDGTVYDPSNLQQSFGFLELKCPYSQREHTPPC